MKVVLDTNVLISGLINIEGIPAQIVNLLINGRIILLYDSRIMKEYEEVLGRKKFGFKKSVVAPLLDWTYPDFVDTLLRCGLPQRILFVLGRRSIVQVRV